MPDEIRTASLSNSVGRVLVADDDIKNRILYCTVLTAEGHCVLSADDGAAALEKALTENPDVILLDVTMPKLDGFEVCRRLRQNTRTAHLPILMITALSSKADRLSGIEAGANDFLSKPVELDELRLRVRNAVYQQHLYTELQAKYRELKAMAELRECLTNMIEADTNTLSSMIHQHAPPEHPADGGRPKGGSDGTR